MMYEQVGVGEEEAVTTTWKGGPAVVEEEDEEIILPGKCGAIADLRAEDVPGPCPTFGLNPNSTPRRIPGRDDLPE